MISYWEKEQWLNNIDFLIIGAGFTGLFSALALRKKYPDAHILVAERHPLALGASTKNAGFACFGSVGEILDDLLDESFDDAIARVVRRYEGLQKLRATIPDALCDFNPAGGFELFRTGEEKHFAKSKAFIPELNQRLQQELGFSPYAEADINSFGFRKIIGAISIAREGMLQPAKAIAHLEKLCATNGISVLHGLEITDIKAKSERVAVHAGNFQFDAAKVLVATNAFAPKLLPDLNVVPARGQVLITSPIADLPFSGTFHMDKGYYYFRNVGKRVLLGGARNMDFEGETTSQLELSNKLQDHLENVLRNQLLPGANFTIEHRWSGIMAFGQKGEKEPLIAEVQPNMVTAIRLGGMGVALSAQVAEEAGQLL